MDWQAYFTSFFESELQWDRTRAAVLAAKVADTIARVERREDPDAILAAIDEFIGEFHDDFDRLARDRIKKQSKGRRRQKKKSQIDLFKSKKS